VSAVPADAEPGTVAVIVSVPELPGASVRRVGETENAAPVVEAVTARLSSPPFMSANVPLPDALQLTAPMSSSVGEKTATAPPSTGPASIGAALVSGAGEYGVSPSSEAPPAVASASAPFTLAPEAGGPPPSHELDMMQSISKRHVRSARPVLSPASSPRVMSLAPPSIAQGTHLARANARA
jgi:hypothetical protein